MLTQTLIFRDFQNQNKEKLVCVGIYLVSVKVSALPSPAKSCNDTLQGNHGECVVIIGVKSGISNSCGHKVLTQIIPTVYHRTVAHSEMKSDEVWGNILHLSSFPFFSAPPLSQ